MNDSCGRPARFGVRRLAGTKPIRNFLTPSVVFSSWTSPGRSSTKLFAYDELEPGPHFVDCADLHVDEPQRQRNFSHDVLCDLSLHVRGFLRPRNPNDGVRIQDLPVAPERAK